MVTIFFINSCMDLNGQMLNAYGCDTHWVAGENSWQWRCYAYFSLLSLHDIIILTTGDSRHDKLITPLLERLSNTSQNLFFKREGLGVSFQQDHNLRLTILHPTALIFFHPIHNVISGLSRNFFIEVRKGHFTTSSIDV